MFSVRHVYTRRFGSQQGPRQTHEPQPEQTRDQAEAHSQGQRAKRGNKKGKLSGDKTRSALKVKLPKPHKKVAEQDKTERRWILEATVDDTETTVGRRGGAVPPQCAGTASDSGGGDVFLFCQRPTSKATNAKKRAKLAVLRTISRVLEENQVLRQRLASLSQAN